LLDEAQNFPQETLETVRLLSDFETPKKKLLQIVFSGQPSFEGVLANPSMLQLRQRVASYCSLGPLTREEIEDYITHRLKVVGRSEGLFSRASLGMIFEVTRGIPREIHNICFESLCLAAERGAAFIDCEMVRESARLLRMRTPTESYVEEELPVVGKAKSCVAVAAASHPFASALDSTATPAENPTFKPAPPVLQSASVPAVPQPKLSNSEGPSAETDLERFRYLFEPGADRPAVHEETTEVSPTKRRTAVLAASVCAIVLAALAGVVAKTDVAGLKKKFLFVAEAREGSPPPETQPTMNELSVPQQVTVPAKRESKAVQKQEPSIPKRAPDAMALVAQVPQISSESTPKYQSMSKGENEPPPVELSGSALPDQVADAPPVVEPAANARLNVPKQQAEVVRPKLLVSPMPKYPDDARRAGIQGVVELEAVIDINGKIKDVRVLKGHPMLIREAIKAAEQQQYTPFLLNSVPHEVPTRIRFIFKP
jgi:TonB family protein